MRSDSPPHSPAAPATPSTKVLLVTDSPSPEPLEAPADGSPLDLDLVPSVAAAAARLTALPADVVVLDATVAAAESGELQRLREKLGRAALLLRAAHYTSDIPALMERLGGAACILPASAPSPVQVQLVTLAAERARLAAALSERVAELEQSRSRFRDVIERNADAIVVVDREGVIRFANAMATELFRSSREELLGTQFGFPVMVGETTELDVPHPDHAMVVEMRVVESEWEGETAYIASLRDVTERRRAEEGARRLIREQSARAAAEKAARRFRLMAEATTQLSVPLDYEETLATLARLCVAEIADCAVIYGVEEDGSVRRLEVAHCDPARMDVVQALREYPIHQTATHPVLEVLRTRSPLLIAEVDDARLATNAQDEQHLDLLRRLGIVSFMLVPLVAREHGLGAIALVSSDPERRFTEDDLLEANDLALRAALAIDNTRLYREAQEANRAKSDLLAVISHDLRTPLNSIMGHADILALGIHDRLSEAGLQCVEHIRIGAAHLLYLIDELLSFARLDAGREELRYQDVDAGTIAREVAAVIEPLALQRGLTFHLDLPERDVGLHTDPDRLRQILLNLVGNAVKYTEDGEVRLDLRHPAAGVVEFHVRDTGIGIRPEHVKQIFEPFWQVDPKQRAPDGGTGLGLSVVRRLVHLLGGEVTVESRIGRGSTFTVRLPSRVGALSCGANSHGGSVPAV
jgi:PAS domain S-box-containing protein